MFFTSMFFKWKMTVVVANGNTSQFFFCNCFLFFSDAFFAQFWLRFCFFVCVTLVKKYLSLFKVTPQSRLKVGPKKDDSITINFYGSLGSSIVEGGSELSTLVERDTRTVGNTLHSLTRRNQTKQENTVCFRSSLPSSSFTPFWRVPPKCALYSSVLQEATCRPFSLVRLCSIKNTRWTTTIFCVIKTLIGLILEMIKTVCVCSYYKHNVFCFSLSLSQW